MNTAVLSDGHRDTEREHETEEPECSGIRALPRLEPGHCISRKYLIRGVLGAGGFAVVYEAEHLGLQCVMAIKVLHVNEHTPDTLIARFREEARISAVVHHRNVLDVHDTGTLEDGSPYLVMERIHGETLHACLSRGPMPIPELLEIARQLLNALCVLSARGIVHRDIKPENLMLHTTASGERLVKLVDFGISKIVRSDLSVRSTIGGGLIGTPHYMSPEHLSGEEVTSQSDIYACGVVLYEALVGQLPYDGASLNALVFAVLNCDVRSICSLRPECPHELERIVLKAMHRDRNLRYLSPEALLADLEQFARTPQTSKPTAAPTHTPRGSANTCFDGEPTGIWACTPLSTERARVRLAPEQGRRRKLRTERARGLGRLLLVPTACLFFMSIGPSTEQRPVLQADSIAIVTQATRLPTFDPGQDHTVGGLTEQIAIPSAQGYPELLAVKMARPLRTHTSSRPHRSAMAHRAAQKQHVEALALAPSPDGTGESAPGSALPVARDHRALLEAALANYVRGRHATAHLLYLRATAERPTSPEAWRGLGIVAARLGNTSEARQALQHYLTLSPAAKDARTIRARIDALD